MDYEYRWTKFKSAAVPGMLPLKYRESADRYEIFTTQVNDTHRSVIYRAFVPWAVVATGYTQAQNDADKADWELNYKPNADGPF